MDSSVAETSARTENDIELGPVTHWPTVYAAAGVAGVVCIGLAAVALLAALQSAPAPETTSVAAVVPAPPPRPRGMIVKTADPVAPAVAEVVPAPEPSPADVLPPLPPPAPIRVATAVTPLIRVSDHAPEPEPPVPPLPAPPPEFALFDDLQAHVHEIDLDTVPGTTATLRAQSRDGRSKRETSQGSPTEAAPGSERIVQFIAQRPDLAGLPVRGATECKTPAAAAQGIQALSRALGSLQAGLFPSDAPHHYDPTYVLDPETFYDLATAPDRNKTIANFLDEKKKLLREENASTLAQMLQAEDIPLRLQLTKVLASIKGRPASQALVRQALFDLTREVRDAATAALKDRPAEEYRPTLLDGFRHPWPTVADHAAAALAALQDRGAVAGLEKMRDLPDPSAPTLNEQKKWVKADLVKVNHLRNCLLCHPPSSSAEDLVRAAIPIPGQRLPDVYGNRICGDAVHADVTYFRQDFSLIEAVKDHGKWPLGQRFDYLVRRRPLTDQELIDMVDSGGEASRSYPQRAAVLFALEKLTRPDDVRPIEKVGLGP